MTKIACVACLDPKISVHTPGFLRAVELAQEYALGPDVQIDLYNDLASAKGATLVCEDIIADQPDIVVGHFASSAACAAAPRYAQAGIQLILPAATRSDLTQHACVFRVCDNDTDYVAWLCAALGRPINAVRSDGSAHGDSVIEMVKQNPAFTPSNLAETVLISGLYNSTIAFAGQSNATTLILTDDAYAPTLAADLENAGVDFAKTKVFVGALETKPHGPTAAKIKAAHGSDPGTYFWETIAALQIAAAKAKGGLSPYGTVLGPMRFDANNEARPCGFHLHTLVAPTASIAA